MPIDRRESWLVNRAEFEAHKSDYIFRYGTMRMMLHTPTMPNNQAPHEQDEFYIVISGSGRFTKSGDTRSFGPGDVIFVEAGAEHRFEEISPDTEVWIQFWGPPGGE